MINRTRDNKRIREDARAKIASSLRTPTKIFKKYKFQRSNVKYEQLKELLLLLLISIASEFLKKNPLETFTEKNFFIIKNNNNNNS